MFSEKLPSVARFLSLVVLSGVLVLLVVSFVRRRQQQAVPPARRTDPLLSEKVVSIVEGYKYVSSEQGKEKFRLLAARDTSYADGRHELEQLDLTTYGPEGKESGRIRADRGTYRQEQGQVAFGGHVIATSADGLEVTSEALTYDQQTEVASTEVAVNFRRAEMSGSAVGALVHVKERSLALLKEARVTILPSAKHKGGPPAKEGGGPPLEVRGGRADYNEKDGLVRFTGAATATHGARLASADNMTGILNPQTRQLDRVELRGQSHLKSQEEGRKGELRARDMDFYFDPEQRLKLAAANGAAEARSLEPDAPREVTAEKIDATYAPAGKDSDLQTLVTYGRTRVKISPPEGTAGKQPSAADRVLEADGVRLGFRPGGKLMERAEAEGHAVLTVTPLRVTPQADRQRLRAPRLRADFYEAENAIRTFSAEGGAVAELEPLEPGGKRAKRVLSGKRMTANFHPGAQEVAELTVEEEAKMTDGMRQATAARAVYQGATGMVALRGQPLVWDETARTGGEEIDAYLDAGHSQARGRVRTTYYSRETAGGAAPFRRGNAPVFVAADRAALRHAEGAALYEGNARAWQDDNFVRAETIEFDRGERQMLAAGSVRSALYGVEREVEPGRKEVVPVFGSADRMSYTDQSRVVHYEGRVKIQQGADQIDAAVADATLDEGNKLSRLKASRDVVLTQPGRRGTGDEVEYTAASDTAVLTGDLARVEDREREVTTKGARLTLHLRDARIEAADEGGTRRVRTTHRIQR